jgi:methylmalonyl-CoA mutase N-terminal domain/subunit
VPADKLGGTIQTDILKEYIAQKEWCFPIEPAMRLVTDMIEWCTESMPRWHPVSISGYHIREAGSTAQQELAFTLKDGFTYVERAIERGLDVDDFAPRLSFFFNAHIDFFEEVAKYRAGSPDLGTRDARDLRRQTAGVDAAALPHADRRRLADRAAAAQQHRPHHPGGARRRCSAAPSRCTPTPSTRRSPCRPRRRCGWRCARSRSSRSSPASQHAIDPLGGSYFVEQLTDEMERAAYEYFARIDELGGMVEAIRRNFPQREIADAAFTYQREVDERRQIVVGVNDFVQADEAETPILRIDPALERKQVERLAASRARRDGAAVESTLADLKRAAAGDANLMPPIVAAARARATEGEMISALQEVFGTYTESPVF